MGYGKQENYGLKTFGQSFPRINSSSVFRMNVHLVYSMQTPNTDIDVVLFVDDFLTSSENDHSSNQLLNILRGKYGEVSETTPSETHLGIKWETLPTGDIKISQPGYIAKILKTLNLESCTGEDLPFISEYNNSQDITSHTHTETATNELRTILGLLNHAAVHTRPDIMFQTAFLATRVTNATINDITQAMHVVYYLQRTKSLGLIFTSGVGFQLEVFIDSSRDLNSIDSKAHSGICFRLGSSKSASFHFISKKQSLVTRSSNEAEIYAVDFGMHDIEYFRQILHFLRCPQSSPTIIYEDNESSISMLSRKTKISTKSSHIFWRYNYALQAIDQGTALMKWIRWYNWW